MRREKNGQYSPVADAFKSYTLVYLATAERDSVRLRSNVRTVELGARAHGLLRYNAKSAWFRPRYQCRRLSHYAQEREESRQEDHHPPRD